MTKSNVITCATHICRFAEHEKWPDSSNQPHHLIYDHSCSRVESTLRVQLTLLSCGCGWGFLHMPCRRGCKRLKDGHCAFMAQSTLLTTLRNMASAHKIFKPCWLYRDLETKRLCCKRGAYVRSALPAGRKLPARIYASYFKKSVPSSQCHLHVWLFFVVYSTFPPSVVASHFHTPCLSLEFHEILWILYGSGNNWPVLWKQKLGHFRVKIEIYTRSHKAYS